MWEPGAERVMGTRNCTMPQTGVQKPSFGVKNVTFPTKHKVVAMFRMHKQPDPCIGLSGCRVPSAQGALH